MGKKKAFIDFDILQYEIGFGVEAYWRYLHDGEPPDYPPPFSLAEEMLEERVAHILAMVDADNKPIMCVTGSNNFRNEIAKSSVYKAGRGLKPYHYKNIAIYGLCRWEVEQEDSLEADDLLGIHIYKDNNAICCSRDKDLLQVPGWHFQWELNKQPQFGPKLVEGYGEIHLNAQKRLKGWGPKLFLAQMIMGDRVDNIPGLPKLGPVAALNTLRDTATYPEGLNAVESLYRAQGMDEDYFLEQANLLYILRERDATGKPKLFRL